MFIEVEDKIYSVDKPAEALAFCNAATPEPHQHHCPRCGRGKEVDWWFDAANRVWFGTVKCPVCGTETGFGATEAKAVLAPWTG